MRDSNLSFYLTLSGIYPCVIARVCADTLYALEGSEMRQPCSCGARRLLLFNFNHHSTPGTNRATTVSIAHNDHLTSHILHMQDAFFLHSHFPIHRWYGRVLRPGASFVFETLVCFQVSSHTPLYPQITPDMAEDPHNASQEVAARARCYAVFANHAQPLLTSLVLV